MRDDDGKELIDLGSFTIKAAVLVALSVGYFTSTSASNWS